MSTIILLDAAFPPSPQQLLNDINSVGAGGCAIYTYGPYTHYTREHVDTLRNAGKSVLPIVVPGNSPGAPNDVLGTTRLYGISGGPIVLDLEPGSEPSAIWTGSFFQAATDQGYVPERYGTRGVLGLYPRADGDWIASWIRTGIMNPVPVLPQGWVAWQFVNDVVINGNTYDVSIVDSSFVQVSQPIVLQSIMGGKMISFRPGGPNDRHDTVFIENGGLVRTWADWISDETHNYGKLVEGTPTGKTLVPGTAFCSWNSDGRWVVFGAQATDGTWWYFWGDINQGNQSGWKPWGGTDGEYKSDVPQSASGLTAHHHTNANTGPAIAD